MCKAESRWREREKNRPPGLRYLGSHLVFPLPTRESEGARERDMRKDRVRDGRLVSGQVSSPGFQPFSPSSFHETPLEAYGKFPFLLAKSPFVKLV